MMDRRAPYLPPDVEPVEAGDEPAHVLPSLVGLVASAICGALVAGAVVAWVLS